MPDLRVFVSSTCYDLSLLRSQLRTFIKSVGFEPVMSDYEDILYDPRTHTHTSCVDEVYTCDILVLIIGSRFGGKSSAEALSKIDFEKLGKDCPSVDDLKKSGALSVTQLEVLKAIESSIPLYVFIESRVYHDHAVYEKNKDSSHISEIIFPSIDKQETAKYIFGFINFIRLRSKGNSIYTFEKGLDIEDTLKKQWASYFQKLLREQRYADNDRRKYDSISEQLENLKIAIITSIDNVDKNEIARSIIKYRQLFDFVFAFRVDALKYLKTTSDDWPALLKKLKLEIIGDLERFASGEDHDYLSHVVFRYKNQYYEYRFDMRIINQLELDWNSYLQTKESSKEVIVDTLSEFSRGSSFFHRYLQPIRGDIVEQFRSNKSKSNVVEEKESVTSE